VSQFFSVLLDNSAMNVSIDVPTNQLKRALREGRPQIGLWSSLASHITVEVVAGSGFDWLVLDTEHAPSEPTTVYSQLQAMTGGTATPVVRPAWNDPVLFKRLLDAGVQSLVVPFVQNADEARRAVEATRFPPDGIRGVAATTRANRYGRVKDYVTRANAEILLVVQLESRVALENLEAIAAVDGIDGLFIGPSDLAANLGHPSDGEVCRNPRARRSGRASLASTWVPFRRGGQRRRYPRATERGARGEVQGGHMSGKEGGLEPTWRQGAFW
jgi:4-hydroxy-2-oxoheptanedioate aldolase